MENLTIDKRISKISELLSDEMEIQITLPIGTYEVKDMIYLNEKITLKFV